MNGFKRIFSWKSLKQNPDTYLLTVGSVVIAGFSIFGSISEEVLGATVVVLLGILAFSQLINRFQIEEVADTWHRARTEIFWDDFPPDYGEAQRKVSKSYFYAGETMGRTMTAMHPHIRRILSEGGSTKILLPNPNNKALMEAISKGRPGKSAESIKQAIVHSFTLANECRQNKGNLELRTTDIMPHLSINGWDREHPSGKIMVQMYEYGADGSERAPIFILEARDKKWFNHFNKQIDKLWADGTEYVI